jgi:hypothetical protein
VSYHGHDINELWGALQEEDLEEETPVAYVNDEYPGRLYRWGQELAMGPFQTAADPDPDPDPEPELEPEPVVVPEGYQPVIAVAALNVLNALGEEAYAILEPSEVFVLGPHLGEKIVELMERALGDDAGECRTMIVGVQSKTAQMQDFLRAELQSLGNAWGLKGREMMIVDQAKALLGEWKDTRGPNLCASLAGATHPVTEGSDLSQAPLRVSCNYGSCKEAGPGCHL